MMRSIAQQLGDHIDEYIVSLRAVHEDGLPIKSSPEKWSKKEILGHLIDSAESNIRRFVVAQYEDSPAIGYNQDKWVAIVNYQQWNWDEITGLWYQLNKQVWQNTGEYVSRNGTANLYDATIAYPRMAG